MSSKSSLTSVLVISGKVALLTVIMFVIFSTAMTLTGVASDPTITGQTSGDVDQTVSPASSDDAMSPAPAAVSEAEQGRTGLIFLAVCFLQTVALSAAIVRSHWRGWRLVLAMFGVMVVVTAILSHIDSLFFLRDMSRGLIAKLVLASTLVAAVFSPVAVWVLGRFRSLSEASSAPGIQPRFDRRWAAVLLGLAALHIVTYFAFGYFVAWQSPEVRAFYGGEDPGSFWMQMLSVVRDTPWLMPVQVARGLLWGLVAVVLAASLKGPRWSAALITAGVLVALFSLPLAIPNPLMPEAVRQAHFLETVLSRGLYGLLAVWFVRSRFVPRGAELSAAEV
jgi:hypothetical protein